MVTAHPETDTGHVRKTEEDLLLSIFETEPFPVVEGTGERLTACFRESQ
tara:strand:- start:7049 stop:7195 length:147 start_codon:yes stop_codon:yes gene_type:complete